MRGSSRPRSATVTCPLTGVGQQPLLITDGYQVHMYWSGGMVRSCSSTLVVVSVK